MGERFGAIWSPRIFQITGYSCTMKYTHFCMHFDVDFMLTTHGKDGMPLNAILLVSSSPAID